MFLWKQAIDKKLKGVGLLETKTLVLYAEHFNYR